MQVRFLLRAHPAYYSDLLPPKKKSRVRWLNAAKKGKTDRREALVGSSYI